MIITFLGNCQAPILANIFNNKIKNISKNICVKAIKPVHLLDIGDEEHLNKTFEDTQLLITQPIQNGYKGLSLGTQELKERLDVDVIVVPNCYFAGYTPNFIYLKGDKGTITSAQYPEIVIDYHDALVMYGYGKGFSIESLFKKFQFGSNKDVYMHLYRHAEKSLKELELREMSCDICISDFIKEQFRDRLLFYTYNHPEKKVIEVLLNRLSHYMSYDINFTLSIDPFSKTRLPIHNIFGNSGFYNFYEENEHSKIVKQNTYISLYEYIKSIYQFYDNNQILYKKNITDLENNKSLNFLREILY